MKMMEGMQDIICAPATGRGGAIAVIRISGESTLPLLDGVFRPHKDKRLADAPGYSLHYGWIADGKGTEVDEVVVAVYRAPHSYTGEDAAEISCHASQYIIEKILSVLIDAGARMAQPGEFTRRAYINGRLDLAQAEAVADVIAASSAASLKVAQKQLRGGYSDDLRSMRDSLLDLSVLLELELDFSEEEVEFADRSKLIGLAESALVRLARLADTFKVGNAIKNGVPVAIAGAPNSGKSTLLNALLGENRAIVSDIAGTTRDTVEETMTIDGIQYRFIDTAGIRDTSDTIEKQGVERSLAAIRKADVVIWLRSAEEMATVPAAKAASDSAKGISSDMTAETAPGPADKESESALRDAIFTLEAGQTLLEVWNKADLIADWQNAAGAGINGACMPEGAIAISALKGTGLEELKRRISDSQKGRIEEAGDTIVTNLRHYEALVSARNSLTSLLRGLKNNIPTDLIAEDLRSAISSLGSIWGEGGITSSETLARLFERHCIGK